MNREISELGSVIVHLSRIKNAMLNNFDIDEYQEFCDSISATSNERLSDVKNSEQLLSCIDHSEYALEIILYNTLSLGKSADKVKRYIFYNDIKGMADIETRPKAGHKNEIIALKSIPRLLHSLLGIVTEAGEMAEAILKFTHEDKELYKQNLIEELGDGAWYLAEGVSALQCKLSNVLKINQNKLSERYSKKEFTEQDAKERDLDKEQEIIKGELE